MIVATVSGAESVARGLDTVAALLGDLSPAFEPLGVELLDTATPLTPTASGALVDSLTLEVGDQGIELVSDLVYAGVQSYGWPERNIEGSGFMQAAEALADERAPSIIEDTITTTARLAGLV